MGFYASTDGETWTASWSPPPPPPFLSIWRWTPSDKAVVPAPELSFTYRISIALVPATELSLLWRHISPFKNMTSQERQLCSGNESYRNSVRERQLWSGNDSSGAGTTALSPGVHRHICPLYFRGVLMSIVCKNCLWTKKKVFQSMTG